MRKTMFALLVAASIFTSCVKEKAATELTKTEIRQKADSIIAVKTKELETASRIDLKLRMKIEVKVKSEAILNAQLAKRTAPVKDTSIEE